MKLNPLPRRVWARPLAATALVTLALPAHALQVDLLSSLTQGSPVWRDGTAEILSYTPDQYTLLSTLSGETGRGVQVMTLGQDGSLSERGFVNYFYAFGSNSAADASSTAADPLGRGFGAVSLIPSDLSGSLPGKVGFFDYREGSLSSLLTLDVGFHPDSVAFSSDGSKLLVANEGEYLGGGNLDAPGSLSVIDLSGVSSPLDLFGLGSGDISTYDFQSINLAPGVSINDLRFNETNVDPLNLYRHVEPEYVTEAGGVAYVSLQENNAFGVFDLTEERWVAINSLGTLTQTVDASDRDGGALIDDPVAGLPMPDTIGVFETGGSRFVVTANEGDFRPDDGDRIRVKDLAEEGFVVDPETVAELNAYYGDYTADEALGRLRVSTVDGDTDGDGDIDVLTMPGTRSFSVWDAETGELVFDPGSLEGLLLSLDPLKHNINGEDGLDTFDKRSDDKGPEPEALTVATLDGRPLLFVAMERQNGVLAYGLEDPSAPEFLGYFNDIEQGLVAPESLLLIDAADSPTGGALLLGGYEVGSGIGVYSVTAAPVPVPAALPLALSALAGLGVFVRRRAAD